MFYIKTIIKALCCNIFFSVFLGLILYYENGNWTFINVHFWISEKRIENN
jgi:hypothetical protein